MFERTDFLGPGNLWFSGISFYFILGKKKGLSFSGRIPRLQRGDLGSIPSRSIQGFQRKPWKGFRVNLHPAGFDSLRKAMLFGESEISKISEPVGPSQIIFIYLMNLWREIKYVTTDEVPESNLGVELRMYWVVPRWFTNHIQWHR